LTRNEDLLCYHHAASCLPPRLQAQALRLPEEWMANAEELRLRCGWPMTVLLPSGEVFPWREKVTATDLEMLVNTVTEHSRYAAGETLKNGYLIARGGCRVGLCGTGVMKAGANTGLRELSSAAIRIARERQGIAAPLIPQLFQEGNFQSTLLIAPPGAGKTTLLRDLIYCLSEGKGCSIHRVSLVDERGEVAAMFRGQAQMHIGRHTDVLDACPKALGIPMLLRSMNPQVIAVDEITVQDDIIAMTAASNCGVKLLATIHGDSVEEVRRKPFYAQLLNARVFEKSVVIQRKEQTRVYTVEALPC